MQIVIRKLEDVFHLGTLQQSHGFSSHPLLLRARLTLAYPPNMMNTLCQSCNEDFLEGLLDPGFCCYFQGKQHSNLLGNRQVDAHDICDILITSSRSYFGGS